MKPKSITFKLFMITSLVLIAFTTVTMLLQSAFIGDFYYATKINTFETNFKALAVDYTKTYAQPDTAAGLIEKFEAQNNARAVVADPAAITAADPLNLALQDKLFVLARPLLQDPKTMQKILTQGQTILLAPKPQQVGTGSIVGVTPIVRNGKTASIIIGAASLQPIGEAATVIRQFYIYFYAIALGLIFLLSTVYSKMIAKPLIKLNKTALEMAELNFTSRCPVKSGDEIGSLAGSLNFLAEKLNSTLGELENANRKLKQDIAKEKQLEKARREFVAGVSHELKTPITLISGYAEGIRDNIVSDAKREYYAEVIIDEATNMAALVSDMLDLAQLESGSFRLNITNFYLHDLIQSLVDKFSNQVHNEHSYAISNPDTDVKVKGDSLRIEQVIRNFLDNAIKHTPPGGTIKVNIVRLDNRVRVEVENPGERLAPENLLQVWDKFYKAEKSRSRQLGGSGIGLAIARDIIELHGNEFGVENTANGVKFYFDLKVAD